MQFDMQRSSAQVMRDRHREQVVSQVALATAENRKTDSAANVPESGRFEYDLNATLHSSRWTYRKTIGKRELIYSPDAPGLPFLLDSDAAIVIDRFKGGRRVGAIMNELSQATGQCVPRILNLLGVLCERGILRPDEDAERFVPSPYRPTFKTMSVWLHVNNYCNLACSYCFVEHTSAHMTSEVIDMTIENLARSAERYGVTDLLVKFAGGEPTLAMPQLESSSDGAPPSSRAIRANSSKAPMRSSSMRHSAEDPRSKTGYAD